MLKRLTPNPANKYSIITRGLHWFMAVIILTQLAIGFLAHYMPQDDSRSDIIWLHKSLGASLFMLFVMRVIFRIIYKGPSLRPLGLKTWEVFLAGFFHFLLYFAIWGALFSGYAMSCSSGYGAHFFGYPLPSLFPKDLEVAKNMAFAHAFYSYALCTLIVIHLLGTLKHLVLNKRNLLDRII